MANKVILKLENNKTKTLATTDTVPTNNLGTGVADNTTYLRGDQTWQALPASGLTQASLLIRETYGGF